MPRLLVSSACVDMPEEEKTEREFWPLSNGDNEFLRKARKLSERICTFYRDLNPSEVGPAELDEVYEKREKHPRTCQPTRCVFMKSATK